MAERYYERELMAELRKWLGRKEIFAIKGPRQSGKTTLVKMLIAWLEEGKKAKPENMTFLTFEDLEVLEKFSANPKEYAESFLEGKGRHYFFFDEFHYAKNGGKNLKLLYDTIENAKFVVTGSSSLEISALSKYLVGRVFSFYLFPFNFHEFLNAKDSRMAGIYAKRNGMIRNFIFSGRDFTVPRDAFARDILVLFEDFIIYGGYPEAIKTGDKETKKVILKNIYETYIGKDVMGLLKISDVFKFRKLVTLLGSQIGGIVNYNELSNVCNSYYKEIIELLHVLEETYVVRIVRPFHGNLKTELRKTPKVYFIDTGLRNYSVSDFNEMEKRADRGGLAENAVFTALFNMTKDFGKIRYWRTLSKAEVDFVLDLGKEVVPVEVKFTEMKKPKVSRSFRSFLLSYKPGRGLVVTKNFWGETRINGTKVKFVPLCYL